MMKIDSVVAVHFSSIMQFLQLTLIYCYHSIIIVYSDHNWTPPAMHNHANTKHPVIIPVA